MVKGIALVPFAALAAIAFAQTVRVTTPPPGSPLRKAVLDGLRPTIEKELKQKVQFKVDILRVRGDYAFFSGKVLQPNGKDIDWKKTQYKEALEEGLFDDWICALIKKGKDGKWQRVTHVIGATDVAWVGWEKEFKFPREVMPYQDNIEKEKTSGR